MPPNSGHLADDRRKASLRMQVRDMMQKAGFTDIHVAAGSLLIRAKDKDGNPVLMNVSPRFSDRSRGNRVGDGPRRFARSNE